jgi:hypothetical protein
VIKLGLEDVFVDYIFQDFHDIFFTIKLLRNSGFLDFL